MKIDKYYTLRTKITVLALIVSFTITIIGFAIVYMQNTMIFKKNLSEKISFQAKIISEYCTVPLVFDDQAGATEVLNRLRVSNEIESAFLYNINGNLFSTYNPSNNSIIGLNLSTAPQVFEKNHFVVRNEIRYQNKKYGYLVLTASTKTLEQNAIQLIQTLIITLIILSLIAFFISIKLSNIILSPLHELTNLIKHIRNKSDFSLRFNYDQPDEISILANGFNRMLNQIEIKTQERDRAEIELKNLNDLLEERVRVRTQELAHANKLLSLYNESQKTILENLPYGLMLINQKQQIIEINQPALDLLGYQKDELQNTKCSLLGCNGNSTNCLLYSDELNQISHEIQLRKKNGDLVTALKNDSPIIYNNETIILETFVDISQLKETEKELIKAKQKAEESDRLKSSFLSNISHEIRTPLNSIIGFSQLLSITNEFSLQDRSKYQSLIRNGADELLALIDDIIDISELESSQCNIRKSNLKLNLLIDNIRQKTETIRKIYNKEYLATQYNIAPDLKDLTILTDEKRFTQIIMNLVSNALKFTENGSINISFEKMEENELLFKIKDTGIGIDSKYHAHIFERFFKIERGKNKLYRGSGLGLAISAGLVELLGGKIWLESEAGIGTTFFVILPIDSKPIITRQRAISLITDAINE